MWSTPAANVGRINAVYPNDDNARDIPDYTQSYLVWVWEYYQQSGDLAFLATNYTALTNVAQYVNRDLNPVTGLITNLLGGGGSYQNGIIDWPSNMRFGYDMNTVTGIGGASTVMNGWAWEDYDVVSRVANELGYTADSANYRAMANSLQAAMNTKLLNASGVYIDGLLSSGTQSTHASQHANAFPLALGIVPAAQQASVASLVVSSNMSVSALGILQLVRALGEANQGPALLNLYTNANNYGWARILALGGTSTWESWTANTDGNSQSHGWGVVGLDGYVRYILGVKPLTPQFDQVQIRPLDFGNGLATASGTVPTDRGAISVEWDRNPAQYHLAVTIPVNVTATVYVPRAGGTNTTVNVDGVSVTGTATNGYLGVSGIGSGGHDIAYVIIASPPVVGFSGGPTNGVAPLMVTFTNLSSNATNYVWNFGDGNTFSTSSSINVTDTYTNTGNYTVVLTATGYGGTNSLTNTAYIVVTPPPPPVASFNGGPTNGVAPLTVTFTNLSSNSTNYVWNFGDGNTISTSSKTNVTDTYTNAGNYTVILTATGLGGTNSLTNTAYIVVTNPPPPVASFNGGPTNGVAPLTVTFTNLSSNSTNYVWNFGDGNTFNTTSKTNVTDTYANVGNYTVILTATGLGGTNSLTNTAYIVVTPPPPPVAGFSGTPTSGAAPLTVTFTNLSSNATNYVWNFGDGNTFNTTSKTNVTDTYANAGNYTVILTATGLSGTNSLTNTAYIVVTPPSVHVAITNADKGGNLTAGTSWVGGVAPGATNVAVFDSTITSANPAYATNVLGTNTTWGEIQILNPALPIQISAGNTLTLNGLNSLGIDMSQAANALTLNCPAALGAGQTWLVANGQKLNVNGVVSGGFPLTINDGSAANGGSVIFGAQANTYSGGAVINGGYVTFGANASAGTGTITIGGGTLSINSLTIANAVNVTGTALLTNGLSASTFTGNWTGAGTLNVIEGTNSTVTFNGANVLSAFTGTIKVSDLQPASGFLRMSSCTGSTAATFDLGNGSAILHTRTGNSVNLGALMGGPNTQVMGGRSSGAANTPYTIGANGLNTTFYGMITNGTQAGATVSLTKVGAGTLTLAGPNAYTGPTTNSAGTLQIGDGNADGSLGLGAVTISNGATLAFDRSDSYTITNNISNAGTVTIIGSGTNTYIGTYIGSGSTVVSNGTLLINGSISNGPVSVAGGTLGGSGSIGGTVAVQAGGAIQPGAGVGTAGTVLTIISNLTLASGSTCIMAVSHNGHTNDQIVSSGVSYGGTLTVITNAGGGALVAGDTFQLFNAGNYGGSGFTTLNLPPLNPGLIWSNSLTINGSIQVVLTPPPAAGFSGTPTNGAAPLAVTFTNLTSNATNYVWNFGDGNMLSAGSNTNVTDIYTNAGNYTVILTADGPGGTSALTNTAYIVVTLPVPVAGFSGTPTNLFVTQAVTFMDASTGSITNWVWSFGDGQIVTNSSNDNVTNTYATAGSYTVSLIVSGAGGSSTNMLANYVVVKPKAAIGGVMLTADGNLEFSGTNGPAGTQYRILTTTDVSLPLGEWTPVWTNVFGADGSYNYTNTLGADPAAFFLLVSP